MLWRLCAVFHQHNTKHVYVSVQMCKDRCFNEDMDIHMVICMCLHLFVFECVHLPEELTLAEQLPALCVTPEP